MDKVCSVDGCNKMSRARGWCSMHYSRWRKTGTTHSQKLYACKVAECDMKHHSKGYCTRHYMLAYHGRPITMHKSCLHCDKPVLKGSRWTELHDECKNLRQKHMNLLKNYNITLEDYYALSSYQKDQCAICSKSVSGSLHVDHSHILGTVRGLLCGNCNRALGLFFDNPESLNNARDYLIMPPALMKKIYELTTP